MTKPNFDRFIYLTDPHLSNRAPSSRIDDYNETILSKIEFAFKYCKANDITIVICGGDLFHSYNIKNRIALRFVDLVKQYKLLFFYCYGNHDIQGNNHNFVDDTALGFCKRYPWFYVINNQIVGEPFFNYCLLSGDNYSYTIPRLDHYEFGLEGYENYDNKKAKVYVVHGNIDNNDKPLIIDGIQKTSSIKDVVTNADLMLCGHYHYGWKKAVVTNVLEHNVIFVNPGSIARVKIDEYFNSFGPRFADIKVGRNKQIQLKHINIPKAQCFDLTSYTKSKEIKLQKNNFIERLTEFKDSQFQGASVTKVVNKLLDDPPENLADKINSRVKKICRKKLEEVVNE